jgi:hypothetical protein
MTTEYEISYNYPIHIHIQVKFKVLNFPPINEYWATFSARKEEACQALSDMYNAEYV